MSRPFIFAFWLIFALTHLAAQTTHRRAPKPASTSALPLVSVKVTGSQRYTSREIVAATGLQTGQTVSESDFKLASERLGETGIFTNVTYSFQFSGEGAKLELQVSDIADDQFVPAYFDNFVWFSDQELITKLRSRVPLFQGRVALDGKLADQVSEALQAILIEGNVPGRVEYLRSGPENGPVDSFLFSVSGQTIRIRNVDFTGAGPGELSLLKAVGAKLQGQDYLRSILRIQVDKNFVPIYLAQGYLKAKFADAQAKVVQQAEQETGVDVTFSVAPGTQYKTAGIELSGSKVLPADKLRELVHQQLGQPANAIQLARDTDAMRKLYGTHGYMAATIKLTPSMDDATSTVKYQIQANEGDQYHMGELDIQDLDRRDSSRAAAKWTLAKGDPYDSSYPKRFVDAVLKNVLTTGEWNISIHELPDPADKSVDVSVKFEHKASEL